MQTIKPFLRIPNYYETDQMAIIHHSNYIRWFEEARLDWLSQVGIHYANMEDAGIAIAVTSAHCNYKGMVRFGDEVLIEITLALLTGSRMTVCYIVRDVKTNEVRTTGETRHCFVNKAGAAYLFKKIRHAFL